MFYSSFVTCCFFSKCRLETDVVVSKQNYFFTLLTGNHLHTVYIPIKP